MSDFDFIETWKNNFKKEMFTEEHMSLAFFGEINILEDNSIYSLQLRDKLDNLSNNTQTTM